MKLAVKLEYKLLSLLSSRLIHQNLNLYQKALRVFKGRNQRAPKSLVKKEVLDYVLFKSLRKHHVDIYFYMIASLFFVMALGVFASSYMLSPLCFGLLFVGYFFVYLGLQIDFPVFHLEIGEVEKAA